MDNQSGKLIRQPPSIIVPVISKGFVLAFGNGFAPVKIFVVLNTSPPTIWGRPHIATLKERIVMAKSSIVASTFPKSPIYHGNKDDSGLPHQLARMI